jgi:hypothetical protein
VESVVAVESLALRTINDRKASAQFEIKYLLASAKKSTAFRTGRSERAAELWKPQQAPAAFTR